MTVFISPFPWFHSSHHNLTTSFLSRHPISHSLRLMPASLLTRASSLSIPASPAPTEHCHRMFSLHHQAPSMLWHCLSHLSALHILGALTPSPRGLCRLCPSLIPGGVASTELGSSMCRGAFLWDAEKLTKSYWYWFLADREEFSSCKSKKIDQQLACSRYINTVILFRVICKLVF